MSDLVQTDEGSGRVLSDLPLLQHDLWVGSQFPPYSFAHVVRSARIHGRLKLDALDRAFHAVVRRHEPLRTVFSHDDGHPYPVVLEFPDDVAMLWDPPNGPSGTELTNKVVQQIVGTPFDFATGPLFRFLVIRESRSSHIVILCIAEIVCDGWGSDVLVADLDAAYRYEIGASTEPLGELDVHYRDIASRERRLITADVYQERLAFWQRTLTGSPLTLPIPQVHPDTAEPVQSSQCSVNLDARTSARVRELCAGHATTPFTFFLTIYGLLLRRHTGQDDLLVESPVANRTRSVVEPMVGFFAAGRLPFRLDVSETETFTNLLRRIGDGAREAIRNAGVPVSVVRAKRYADIPRGLNLIQARFRFRVPIAPIQLGQLQSEPYPVGNDVEQLAFWAEDLGDAGFRLTLVFDENIMTRDDARRLLTEAALMTTAAVTDPTRPPAEIAYMPKTSARSLVGAATSLSAGNLADVVTAVAAATPDAIAVDDPDGALTYGALDADATRLASVLASSGIGPGALVTIDVPPSADCVVATLATLRARATCALDTSLSAHATIARASDGALAVLTHDHGDAVPSGAFVVGVHSDGSAVVGHEALLNVALWQVERCRLGPADRVAIEPGPGGAAWQLGPWAALAAGATVVVPSAVDRFSSWLAESSVTVAVVHHDPGPLPDTVRLLLTDGAVPDGLSAGVEVVRLLRLAEVGGVAAFAVGADPFQPIPNVTLGVVDAAGLPVPQSTMGTLTVTAPGVSNRAVGWLASVHHRGVTAHGPRWADLDLHGFRLSESVGHVEAALADHPGIADAALGTAAGEWGDVLTAYVVPQGNTVLDAEVLDRWLVARGVQYLPSSYVSVDTIPRSSRWVDRRVLHGLGGRLLGPIPGTPPRTPTENILVSIASELTGRSSVGVHDDFFRAVGDAATALRFVLKGRAVGLDLSAALVNSGRTIARMATALDEHAARGPEQTGLT